jgi:hypothetical protein
MPRNIFHEIATTQHRKSVLRRWIKFYMVVLPPFFLSWMPSPFVQFPTVDLYSDFSIKPRKGLKLYLLCHKLDLLFVSFLRFLYPQDSYWSETETFKMLVIGRHMVTVNRALNQTQDIFITYTQITYSLDSLEGMHGSLDMNQPNN